MGLFDGLNGNTYALNTTVKGEAHRFIQYASNFSEKSFLNTFFKSIAVASQIFCSYLFESKTPHNFFNDNIKKIDSKKANKLMKILASFYCLQFVIEFENEDEQLIECDGETISDIQVHLYKSLNFEQDDEEIFSTMYNFQNEDLGRFFTIISMLIQSKVLDLPTTPDVYFSEAVTRALADSYVAFGAAMGINNL